MTRLAAVDDRMCPSVTAMVVMATTILAIIPPVVIVLLMQRWFVKGLIESEK